MGLLSPFQHHWFAIERGFASNLLMVIAVWKPGLTYLLLSAVFGNWSATPWSTTIIELLLFHYSIYICLFSSEDSSTPPSQITTFKRGFKLKREVKQKGLPLFLLHHSLVRNPSGPESSPDFLMDSLSKGNSVSDRLY